MSRPRAESDLPIVGCYLAAAGDMGRDDADVAALQQQGTNKGAGETERKQNYISNKTIIIMHTYIYINEHYIHEQL